MSRRAVLGLVLAGGAGLAGAQQTGAFSSVTGDRGFDVQTASDQNALLGIQRRDPTGSDGDEVPLFTLTNRFDGPLTVEVTRVSVVSSGAFSLNRDDITEPGLAIGPSEQANVLATLSCDSSTSGDVELELTASTDDESVELTRVTTVTCRSEGPDRCPVVPQVSVSVSGDASSTITKNGDIDLKHTEVDGDVVSQAGSDGDVGLNGVDVTGIVQADGSIGQLKHSAVGGTVRSNGDIDSLKNTEVGGDVLTTDGSDGDITAQDVTIAGDVVADGSIGRLRNATVGGFVRSNGDISSLQNSKVGGDVITTDGSDGDIDLTNATVCGVVTADGDVEGVNNAKIGGDLSADGDVKITSGSRLFGDVIVSGDGSVTVDGGATVSGSVEASGGVSVGGGGTVEGAVNADGDVTVNGNGTVGRTVKTDGDVSVDGGGTVGGDVDSGGDVTVSGGGTVEGTITAGGSIDAPGYNTNG